MISTLRVNAKQLNRFSEICMGLGHIAVASVVIPAFFMVLWGLAVAGYSWYVSVHLLRRQNGNR